MNMSRAKVGIIKGGTEREEGWGGAGSVIWCEVPNKVSIKSRNEDGFEFGAELGFGHGVGAEFVNKRANRLVWRMRLN